MPSEGFCSNYFIIWYVFSVKYHMLTYDNSCTLILSTWKYLILFRVYFQIGWRWQSWNRKPFRRRSYITIIDNPHPERSDIWRQNFVCTASFATIFGHSHSPTRSIWKRWQWKYKKGIWKIRKLLCRHKPYHALQNLHQLPTKWSCKFDTQTWRIKFKFQANGNSLFDTTR